jgi:RNA polymerase sigma-70 factor (ECF subfamily)
MTSPTLELPRPVPAPADGWDLVEDVQCGRIASFGVLYERYSDSVLAFVCSRGTNPAHAEDLTSEAFIRLFTRINSFTDRGKSVRALLFTIARNLVIDHARSKYSRSVVAGFDPLVDTRPATDDIEASVIRGHQLADLAHHLELLTPIQRDCVFFRFCLELSVAETSAAMGKPVGAIRQLQHRAVQRLAELMREEWA